MSELGLTSVPYSYPSLTSQRAGGDGADTKAAASSNTLIISLTQAFQLQAQKLNDNFSKIEIGVDPLLAIPAEITTINSEIATINSEITTINGEIAALQSPAYLDAALNTNFNLVDSTWTLLSSGWTVNADNKSWWSTNKWTPKIAGRYRISCGTSITATVTGDTIVAAVGLALNGAVSPNYFEVASWNGTNPLGNLTPIGLSRIIHFNGSTDYIQVMAYAGSVTAAQNVAPLAQTYIAANYIGP